MEVVFDNAGCEAIQNLNFKITDGTIVGFCGTDARLAISGMLMATRSLTSGEIIVGKYTILSNRALEEIHYLRRTAAYLPSNPDEYLFNKTVVDEMMFSLIYFDAKYDENTVLNPMLQVGLDYSYINRKVRDLSTTEKKRLMLSSSIAHGTEVFIFEDFEKGMDQKTKQEFKKLIRQLKKDYNKTIIVISNETDYLFDLCDYVYCVSSTGVVMEGNKDILLAKEIYNYVPKPKIIDCIDNINEQGHDAKYYLELGELLKAVYRDVK